jgi:Zn-dependent protease
LLNLEPERTRYDLEWRIFHVPVRIHPFFFLINLLFGASLMQWLPPMSISQKLQLILLWTICVLVSILFHELGHVWAGQWFGRDGRIVLYHFGGLAIGSSDVPKRWQRIVVYLAGPGAQLLIWGLIQVFWWVDRRWLPSHQMSPWAGFFLYFMEIINLGWALLNLAPVIPLDGGQVSREVWQQFRPGQGLRYALLTSVVVGVILAIISLAEWMGHPIITWLTVGGGFTCILFACLAASNYVMYRQVAAIGYYEETRAPWEQDPDFWKQ